MPDASSKSRPLVTVMARYGLISGLLSLASAISFYYMGKHPFWIYPMFDVRILFIAIFLVFGLREVRDYFFGGILFFWQGLGGSLVFLGVMATLCYAGIMAFGSVEPGFLQEYIRQGFEQISALSPDALQQIGAPAVEETKQHLPNTTLEWMARRYATQTFGFGFFITIIIAVVLRRQPKIE
ncbi:MAG: DUF4199 domain-containing protein [Bacteroidota bacterium]